MAGAWWVNKMCRMGRQGPLCGGKLGKECGFYSHCSAKSGRFSYGTAVLLCGVVFGAGRDEAVVIKVREGGPRY